MKVLVWKAGYIGMNRVYKLVWSKVRNCYVVASELAKQHGKVSKSSVMGKTLVAGVLACIISCGAVMPVLAADPVTYDDDTYETITLEGPVGVGTVITGLADGQLSAASMDAVTGAQLYQTNQKFGAIENSVSNLSASVGVAQTDISNLKTNYTTMRSDVNTLQTQVETGFNVTVDGAKVKTVNPGSNYINFIAGDNVSLQADGENVVISASGGSNVSMNNGRNTTVVATHEGDNVSYAINVIGTGVVAVDNDGLLNGSTAYTELRPADGNYVKQANTTAANLTALDTQVKANADNITGLTGEISDLTAALDDKANVGLDNISDNGKTVIRNLAKESVKVVAGTHTTVTEGTDGNAKTYAVNVATDGSVASRNTGIVNGGTVYEALQNARNEVNEATDTKLEGYAKIDGSNVTTPATWGAKLGTGAVASGNGELVTGGTVYTELRPANGTYVKQANTTAANLKALDSAMGNKADTSLSNINYNGRNVINSYAREAVKVESQDNSVVVKELNMEVLDNPYTNGYRLYDISVKKNGEIADGNTGLVTGGDIYDYIKDISGGSVNIRDLEAYAKKDASNVADNAESWGTAVGTGTVTASDSKLVTGKTVYEALQNIDVAADGIVAEGNTKAVSGGTVYTELRPADGTYVKKANTTAANLTALDTQVKANTDTVGTLSDTVGNLSDTVAGLADDVSDLSDSLDNKANKDASNVAGHSEAWGEAIGTGAVADGNKELVTGGTVYKETRSADGNYVSGTNSAGENISALDTALKGLETANADLRDGLDGKANTSLNNLTNVGKDTIRTLAQEAVKVEGTGYAVVTSEKIENTVTYNVDVTVDGEVTEGNTGIVTGGKVYDSIKEVKDSIADVAKEAVAKDLDKKANKDLGNITDGGKTVIREVMAADLAGKADTDLGNITDNGKTVIREAVAEDLAKKADITYVDEGLAKKADKDSVYTKKQTDSLLKEKADVDASNIDALVWADKLGVGEVTEGNTGLVNGGTVYDTIQKVNTNNNLVHMEDDIIFVGDKEGGNEINIRNKDGEGRTITGVITNPNDPTSAANVDYVDAMGKAISDSVNHGFNRINDKVNKVGANAAAMASLMPAPMDGDEKWSVSAAVGNYRNATAGAAGVFYRPQDNVMLNLRGSFGSEENMVGGGIAVAIDRGNKVGVTKAQLVRTVNAQAKAIQDMRQNYEGRIAQLEAMVRRMATEKKS